MSLRETQTHLKAEESKKLAAKKETPAEEQEASIIPTCAAPPPLEVKEVAKAVSAAEASARKVGFTMEQAEAFSDIAPALRQVCEALAKERRPAPWHERDPATTAESFLKDSKTYGPGQDLITA